MQTPMLSVVAETVRDLAVEDRTGWSGAARSALVPELLAVEEAVHAAVLRCVGEWEAMGAWAEDGALTPSSWIAHRTPVTTQSARELVRDARLVQGNQATAKALSAGEVSTAHVDAAARAAGSVRRHPTPSNTEPATRRRNRAPGVGHPRAARRAPR
jgi:hypothetical protein